MDNIQDIDAYVKSMSTTLFDKCWWLDKIPPEIDTIVDYGCAQGDLAIFIDRIYPGRFKYIGIDNSPEMLALASHNHHLHFAKPDSEFYAQLSGVAQKCDTRKTILVLNSVMHEIFSYLTEAEQKALLSEMFGAGFAYIAIRDMYMPEFEEASFDMEASFKSILCSPYAGMWNEFNHYLDNSPRSNGWWNSIALRMAEFLMKYRYVGNWQREMKETYFWPWLPMISSLSPESRTYKIAFTNRFYIPFIRDKVSGDFGIDFQVETHRKVLLAR